MNTFFIPLPDDEARQAALIGFLAGIDEYLPGEIVITNQVKVQTNNQRLAEMLRLGLEDCARTIAESGIVTQYVTFDEPVGYGIGDDNRIHLGALETTQQPAGLPYLLREEPADVGAPTTAPDPTTGHEDHRKTCPECGSPFDKRGRYCSQKCYMKAYWRANPGKSRKGGKTSKDRTRKETSIVTPEPDSDVRQVSGEKRPSGQRKIVLSTITNP
jgi:hypothetical protein